MQLRPEIELKPESPSGLSCADSLCMPFAGTPGPWEVVSDPSHFGSNTSIVGGRKGRDGWREMMVEVGGLATLETQEANARLIAAAPKMVEIMRLILEDDASESGLYWPSVVDQVRDLFCFLHNVKAHAPMPEGDADNINKD